MFPLDSRYALCGFLLFPLAIIIKPCLKLPFSCIVLKNHVSSSTLREGNMPSNLYIVWSRKQHSVKIPIIDEQHRALVSTTNSLFFLSRYQYLPKALLLTLGVLQEFAETHFITEEILMEMTEYSQFEDHKNEHEVLRTRLKILFAQSRKSLNSDALMSFLTIWWKDHVAITDKAYADHVSEGLRKLGKL